MDPTKDNATLGVNSNFPMTLLFIATKDINADPSNELPINLPYGGKYWCDDKYPIELQAQAIRRYQINIYTSTEDTDGDWTVLQNFPQLSQLFPPSYYATSPSPTEAAPTTVTLALPEAATISDKKRSNPSPRIIKDARQRTMDAYIMKRTLAQDPKEGVSNSLCNDLTDIDVLPAAMNSNLLSIEILPLPTINASTPSIANSTASPHPRDEHIESTLDHDKRDVFI
jgi:hypothetical protein